MTQENNNCLGCQKSIGINKNEESGTYKYIRLGRDWNGRTNTTQKGICLSCFNKNQEQYKQEWDDIEVSEGSWQNYGVIGNTIWPNETFQTRCKMKNCGKKFDCQTAEKDRHEWSQNSNLDTDDHEELNKNPAPVKTMEDLVKQWMKSMGYQKIYWDKEERMWKKKKTDGTILERWGVSPVGSWSDKLEKWLEEQPNKEIEVKAEREREREQNWGTTETNCWTRSNC